MATTYSVFDSTPGTLIADLKAKILLSTDWANITGNILKATTTRGAQMVVDLTDAAANSNRLQLGIYRTHDGTTGVDKLVRYLSWNDNTPANTTVLHCTISAGKEHLVIQIEGPRVGETGVRDTTHGSAKQSFFLTDLVPYHAADTVPAVVCSAHWGSNIADQTRDVNISRNQDNNASWQRAGVLTLQGVTRHPNPGLFFSTLQPIARGDGKYYVWPFVIVDHADGIRGRVAKVFNAGGTVTVTNDEVVPAIGTKITFNGEGYTLNTGIRSGFNYDAFNPYAFAYRINGFSNNGQGPGNVNILAIPNGL